MANISFFEDQIDVTDLQVGDVITLTGNVEAFAITDKGLESLTINGIEIDVEKLNRDSLNGLRNAMDRASLAPDPTRAPVPSPG